MSSHQHCNFSDKTFGAAHWLGDGQIHLDVASINNKNSHNPECVIHQYLASSLRPRERGSVHQISIEKMGIEIPLML